MSGWKFLLIFLGGWAACVLPLLAFLLIPLIPVEWWLIGATVIICLVVLGAFIEALNTP